MTSLKPNSRLIALLGIAALAVLAIAPAQAASIEDIEQSVFKQINAERASRGLEPLALKSDIVPIARWHSKDQATRMELSHRDSKGRNAGERLDASRIPWLRYGENVGYVKGYENITKTVVDAWLKSPGHATNLLDPDLRETAVGVAQSADGTYFLTQVFVTR